METQNKNSIWSYIVVTISLISLILFMAISFYNWNFLDDFVFLQEMRENSIMSFAFKWYYQWDARFLMPYTLTWFIAMKYLGIKLLVPLASLSFILCSYNIVRIISRLNNYKWNWIHFLSLTALVNMALWICLYHIDSQILYWMTGSVYLHAMLLALIWLNIYFCGPKGVNRLRVLFYLFSFIVATSEQNISIGLLVLIAIDRIIYSTPNERSSISRWNINRLLIIFIIGILVSTVSPGSLSQFNRMHAINYDAAATDNTLVNYIYHFIGLYVNALKQNGVLLIMMSFLIAIAAVVLSGSKILGISFEVNFLYEGINLKRNLERFKWLLVPIGTLAIYWPTLLYGDRYYIGFYFYLFVGLVILFSRSINALPYMRTPIYIFVILILVLLFGNYKYYGVLRERQLVAYHMEIREGILQKSAGAPTVYLEAIDFQSFSRPSRCTEITSDEQFYANKNYASYFGIDTIRVSHYITKQDLKRRTVNERK